MSKHNIKNKEKYAKFTMRIIECQLANFNILKLSLRQ